MQWYQITVEAAKVATELIGSGNKLGIDLAATHAMRNALDDLPNYRCKIVMGEGIKDNAPGLFAGEVYGGCRAGPSGYFTPAYDVQTVELVCDPVDGTTQTSINGVNAVSCMAVGFQQNTFFTTDAFYMKKMLVGPSPTPTRRGYGLNDPISDIVKEFEAYNRRKPVVMMLSRPKNYIYQQEFEESGAKVQLITDCDITACMCVANNFGKLHENPDIYYGIGGAAETVIIAPLAKCFGLQYEAQIWDKDAGLTGKVLKVDDLVHGDALFCATGITNGYALDGIFAADNISRNNSIDAHTNGSCRIITQQSNRAVYYLSKEC